MAEIRINKLMRQFNVGLADIVDFLRKEGADIDENPNFKVSDEYLPALHERFGKDAEMKKAMENIGKLLKNDPDAQPISINSGSTKAKKKAAKKASQNATATKSTAIKKAVPVKATPAKVEPTPVFDDGLDWGAFSADIAQPEPVETTDVDTSELEMKICEAVKGILEESALELSPENRLNILQRISDSLDFSLELSATELTDNEEEEVEEEAVPEQEVMVDVDFEDLVLGRYRSILLDYFSNTGSGATLHRKREKVTEFLKTEKLEGDDFWYLVDIAMESNADVFRKPFAEGVQAYGNAKKYISRTGAMQNAIDLMMANKEKFKQTVDFLLPFASILSDVTQEDVRNNFRYLTEIDSMQKAFTILKCNLDKKLYLLSSNDSVDSVYFGLRLLLDFKEANGKDSVEGLKFFYPYLNCMTGSCAKDLAGEIIRRVVLEDISEDDDSSFADYVCVDVETANEQPSSICSIGFVWVKGNEIVDSFYSLVNPEPDYYNWHCQQVHGLGPCDTDDAPVFSEVWRQVEDRIGDLPLVAHNSRFDEGCIKAAFRVYQMDYPDYVFYDTLKGSRDYFGNSLPNHRLDTIAAACGFDLRNHHNALADAEACAHIAMTVWDWNR